MKPYEDEDREGWMYVRATRRPTSEWDEPQVIGDGPLARLLASGRAACANDVIADRWTDKDATTLKVLCARCPLQRPCLQYALDHDVVGVWGGTTRKERMRLRRQAPEPVGFGPFLTSRSS